MLDLQEIVEIAEEFWRTGYVVLEDFFDADVMDDCNRIILDHYGMDPEWEHTGEFLERSATEVIPWFPYREGRRDFDVINDDKRLNLITEAILGPEWTNLYCMSMFSKQGTTGQAWHQDCEPEDPRRYNLNRLVYTHDINENTGGQTLVIPGSHRDGLLPAGHPHDDIEGQVVLTPRKGTVVFLHGHAWHRVWPITGAYRVSTNFRAVPNGTPEDITDICVYRNLRYRFSTNEVIEER